MASSSQPSSNSSSYTAEKDIKLKPELNCLAMQAPRMLHPSSSRLNFEQVTLDDTSSSLAPQTNCFSLLKKQVMDAISRANGN